MLALAPDRFRQGNAIAECAFPPLIAWAVFSRRGWTRRGSSFRTARRSVRVWVLWPRPCSSFRRTQKSSASAAV